MADLAERHANFTWHLVLSEVAEHAAGLVKGLVHEATREGLLRDHADIHACDRVAFDDPSRYQENTMTIAYVALPLVLLAGCSSPDSASPTPAATPAAAAPAPAPAPITSIPTPAAPAVESPATALASARGVVESVDAAAKTVTIATDAVESLKWLAMTMTYQVPDIDLGTIKQGDKVSFDVTAVGMDGTITSIKRQ